MPVCASTLTSSLADRADGYKGMSGSDNAQALRIAKSLKRFTDAGVVTWLRFGHELCVMTYRALG